jgi:hypothetical protein
VNKTEKQLQILQSPLFKGFEARFCAESLSGSLFHIGGVHNSFIFSDFRRSSSPLSSEGFRAGMLSTSRFHWGAIAEEGSFRSTGGGF